MVRKSFQQPIQSFLRQGLPTQDFVLHIGRVQPDNHVKEILNGQREGKTLVAVGDYSTTYGKKLYRKYQS